MNPVAAPEAPLSQPGRPQTLNQLFLEAVQRFHTGRAALRYKSRGAWQDISHSELADRVHGAAAGLRAIGLRPDDRVAILSPNGPEWAIADYAALAGRCVSVPIYPSLPAAQTQFILRDCRARAVFVSRGDQHAKITSIRRQLPDLQHVVLLDTGSVEGSTMTLGDLWRRGATGDSDHSQTRREMMSVGPDDLATVIYTSGTTGAPKGVMLTHGNFASNVVAVVQVLPFDTKDSCLSFLPLSHSFERMAGHYVALHIGCTIHYAESLEAVPANLLEVQPTIILAVPRFFEKMYVRSLDAAFSAGAVRRRLFSWARRSAEQWADSAMANEPLSPLVLLRKHIADLLVFAQLRARTGGRVRFFVSGGAPLSPEIARFFYAAGLPILEGYGLTETSPVISVNPYEAPRFGTVGKPIPGVDVRIAEDGEVIVHGPNVMKGYYGQPRETDRVLGADGWLHTGDLGELDPDGYLTITDRKKDIIVTSTGRHIAPLPIENLLRSCPFITNAVVVGEGRKFPVVLVVPDRPAVTAWAAQRHLLLTDGTDLFTQPDVIAKIEREVMLSLRKLKSSEMPRKVVVVDDDFSVEGGQLTPSLKVKRRVIEGRYRSLIDEAYREPAGSGPRPREPDWFSRG